MAGTMDFIVVFCAVLISMCPGEPVKDVPAPTNLTFTWMDDLTVNVSWTRPQALQDLTVKFAIFLEDREPPRTEDTYFLETLLTDPSKSYDHWKFSVRTVLNGLESSAATVTVSAPKPRAEVKNFRCYLFKSGLNCSWSLEQSAPISLYYRDCGASLELVKTELSECSRTFVSGERSVCHIEGTDLLNKNFCMVAKTVSAQRSFNPKYAVMPSDMKISEDGDNLSLTLVSVEDISCLLYNVCYSVCNSPLTCLNYPVSQSSVKIPYARDCQYRFQNRAQTLTNCPQITSDWSEPKTYGFTDFTRTVVAIVIPLIVSACVLLSCYCFRRHKDIICPEIPDPSTIFKEMINGNKETKMPVYTPVQEHVVHNITVLDIPQNPPLV